MNEIFFARLLAASEFVMEILRNGNVIKSFAIKLLYYFISIRKNSYRNVLRVKWWKIAENLWVMV